MFKTYFLSTCSHQPTLFQESHVRLQAQARDLRDKNTKLTRTETRYLIPILPITALQEPECGG